MKFKIVFISLILLATRAFSQYKTESGYIGLTIGTGVPSGNFASNDFSKRSSGFANSGLLGELSLIYSTAPGFSFTASLRSQSNPFDTKKLENFYYAMYPGMTWSISDASWLSTSLAGGVQANFSLNTNTFLYFKANLGIALISTPELTIVGRQGIYSGISVTERVTATPFYSSFGTGLRIGITESIGLLIDADYSIAKADFKNVKTTYTFAPTTTDSFSQECYMFNFKTGVAFTIKSKYDQRKVPQMPIMK